MALVAFAVLAALLFPSHGLKESPERAMAHNDLLNIVAAVKQYYTEYGTYPPVSPDGRILTPELNSHLVRILQGPESNSKRIMFLDLGKPVWRGPLFHKKLCNGLDPATGAFLDSWGNPYRIAYDVAGLGQIESPYEDQRDVPIQSPVIAWSLGPNGSQSLAYRSKEGVCDDLITWHYSLATF